MSACALVLMLWLLPPNTANADATSIARADTVYVYPEVTRADSIGIARLELDKEQANPWWWEWGTAIAVAAGLLFTWWRIKVSQGTAAMVHYDDTFREYLARFADREQSASIRSAAAIGLGGLGKVRNPLTVFREPRPFRQRVVTQLVESFRDEDDKALLGAIRDELVKIGPAALQTLVNKHREIFPVGNWTEHTRHEPGDITTLYTYEPPSWLPIRLGRSGNEYEVHVDDMNRNLQFVHSRDVICEIIRKAKFGNLARHRVKFFTIWDPFGVSRMRWLRWFVRFRWLRHMKFGIVFRRRWLDQNGLKELALPGARLYSTDLRYVDMMSSQLSCARISNVTFAHAYLVRTQMNDADLNGVVFDAAVMSVVQLNRSEHFFTFFRRAELHDSSFKDVRGFPTADFTYADLAHASFDNTNLTLATVRYAQLQGAGLKHARLGERRHDEKERNWTGANWWDDEPNLMDEQRDSFTRNYPQEQERPHFLQYWKRVRPPFEGYKRRRWFGRVTYPMRCSAARIGSRVRSIIASRRTDSPEQGQPNA